MGLCYGLFISSAALASCVTLALEYGILQARTAIRGWRLSFIVEGSPTTVLALVARLILSSPPSTCRLLKPRQTKSSPHTLQKGERHLNVKQVFAAFYDDKNYLAAAIIACLNTTYNLLLAFLPTIIAEIGIGTTSVSQGLSALPYFAEFLTCITASMLSDRCKNRGFFTCGHCCIGGSGYLLLSIVDTIGVRYLLTFLICIGKFLAVALTFTLLTDNQVSDSKRGAVLVVFALIGQCGFVIGTHLFHKSEALKYIKSMAICPGILFFAAIVAQVLSLCLRMQDHVRDWRHGRSESSEMPQEIFDLGDDHPMYRYVLYLKVRQSRWSGGQPENPQSCA